MNHSIIFLHLFHRRFSSKGLRAIDVSGAILSVNKSTSEVVYKSTTSNDGSQILEFVGGKLWNRRCRFHQQFANSFFEQKFYIHILSTSYFCLFWKEDIVKRAAFRKFVGEIDFRFQKFISVNSGIVRADNNDTRGASDWILGIDFKTF